MSVNGKLVCGIIPASDVSPKELAQTIGEITSFIDQVVLVVNSEEPDYSHAFLPEFLVPVRRIIVPFKVGKAEALRIGLGEVAHFDSDIIVQIDGHAKQALSGVRVLCETVGSGEADIALYDRYAQQEMSGQSHRIAISTLFATFLRETTGLNVPDTVCGTRAYTAQLAGVFSQNSVSHGYGIELEQLYLAVRNHARIISCPIISNRQANGTNADKILQSLLVVASNATGATRRMTSAMIVRMQAREAQFSIELDSLRFTFTYCGDIDGAADAYALELVT